MNGSYIGREMLGSLEVFALPGGRQYAPSEGIDEA